MANECGTVTLARTYDPYGNATSIGGISSTACGFTGEQYGESTQLVYLRMRFYNPI